MAEMEGAVTVCVRVRPLIARESAVEDKASLYWKSENNTISEVNGTKVFSYDRVFHSSDNTQQLYEGVAVPVIQSAVQGYNGTIFAYGQTASGKTYTMMGNKVSMGVIPKAIQHVFKVICEIPEREFLLRISYMEIYNETITDLLCDTRKKKPLGIREDVNRNTYVEDLIEEVVVSPEQVMAWIRRGEKNRHYGETKMNARRSRSHTIFRMIIESRERSDLANGNCDGAVMVSHLNLVDLAGSERASQTGSEGVRLKEGCNINRSLFVLGQVIKKLCDDPSGFINYRDSKLTRILQNSLGGNAKTVIICTITPVSFDETLSTLQFANTAKRMKNTPKVNEVLDDDAALLKRYRKEILDLKKQLEEVSSKTQIHAMEKDQLAQLLEEKNSLQKVQEDRIRNLTEMLVTSASFSSKDNVKVKRKRRVTWAPGEISQQNVSCFEEFENSRPTEAKKMKMSSTALPEMEDSVSENCEQDNQSLVLPGQISEVEWTAGPDMNWDIAENKVNILQADFKNLVLENEQLKLEISAMKEKLKEKIEIDEFETLEKQTPKDDEILDKCEELRLLKSEREKLLSEVADHEIRLKNMTEEIGKSKDSLADAQLKYMKSDQEYGALQQLHEELEQKYAAASENNEQMKLQIAILAKEAQETKTTLDRVQLELTEVTENLTDVSSKYDKLLAEKEEMERTMNEQIFQQLEKITLINQEKEELQQMVETYKAERDQLEERALAAKVQKLENVINEVGKNITEKDAEINTLQEQLQIKAATSELGQLQARLTESEKHLTAVLKVNQSLQAEIDKGAEPYKEEMDHLKTQLVKCDMERRKQSSFYEMKLANYKALAEHQQQQLRKLKEELRRALKDQDVSVLEKEPPQQSQIPLTCGGGSGIVQSTQILVLKSEQAKLQKENLQLKKQNDLLLSNELQLKEELVKWKERALRWKERSSREATRETVPRSPRKTVSSSLKEQIPLPSEDPASQEPVARGIAQSLPLAYPGTISGAYHQRQPKRHLFTSQPKN